MGLCRAYVHRQELPRQRMMVVVIEWNRKNVERALVSVIFFYLVSQHWVWKVAVAITLAMLLPDAVYMD